MSLLFLHFAMFVDIRLEKKKATQYLGDFIFIRLREILAMKPQQIECAV